MPLLLPAASRRLKTMGTRSFLSSRPGQQPVHHTLDREAPPGNALTSAPDPPGLAALVLQPIQECRQFFGPVGIEEEPGSALVECLGGAASTGSDDGQARRQTF